MKNILLVVAITSIVALSSCKKDFCTIDGEKISCEDTNDVSKCSATQLKSFKTDCESFNGKLSSK